MKRKFHFLGHIVLALAAIAGFGAIVMLLWNWLIPAVFGWATVNFWQALGLLVLARLLFGGMSHHRMKAGMHRHRNPIREKWLEMTPEERKEFAKNHHWKHHGFGNDCRHDFFRRNENGKPEQREESETK